jgi:NAD(P)-dependent dehydrogenase (short-subunit alcohol dehydrogenase family)
MSAGALQDFQGRRVVVTGGAGALGEAVVALLLERGAQCRVPVHGALDGASATPRAGLEFVERCNLAVEADVARLYDGAAGLWASIHVAGGFEMAPAEDTDRAALMRMLDMNLVSCHLCCRAALRTFAEQGGRIVNVAAQPALEPRLGAGKTAYAASKAAVAALTQALAAEVAGRGVLVNAVAPSTIDTPANRRAMPKANHALWPQPRDIAETIAFLASPGNRVTSGAVVPVYGRA